LRSESHQSDYSDSSKTESISKTDTTSLDALKVNSNYSATTLNYFLDIKKNGRFKINGAKNYKGAWESINDTITLKLKDLNLYGIIKDNYLGQLKLLLQTMT